jgi:RimJ/RimL family protein N-acetyltransferase
LFEGDTSFFVDERFKTYEGAKEYAKFNSVCGAYLPKHGCQDWFFKLNNEYAGVLHLYDLSLETFGQNNKRAWIGFVTAEKFRNQRISFQVVSYFIQFIFDKYPVIDFIHVMTLNENKNAISFIKRCGFVVDTEERLSKDYIFFIRRRAGLS